jgi:ankyrin repeat protein
MNAIEAYIQLGDLMSVRRWIDEAKTVSVKLKGNVTPLEVAAECGQEQMVEWLLEAGADVNYRYRRHWAALHGACYFGRTAIVKTLMEAGSDINMILEDGRTPLWMALRAKEYEIVKLLIDAGAKLSKGLRYYESELMIASYNQHIPSICSLLSIGANPNDIFEKYRALLRQKEIVNAVNECVDKLTLENQKWFKAWRLKNLFV